MPGPSESQITRARKLRRNANSSEQRAWEALRRLRAEGLPVRRQHPIGPYVVDFAVVKAALVIEIDGGVHGRPDVQARDQERDGALSALGWRVLRVSRETVFESELLLSVVRRELGL